MSRRMIVSLGEKRKYTRRQTRIIAAPIAAASSDSLYRFKTRTRAIMPAEKPSGSIEHTRAMITLSRVLLSAEPPAI